MAKQLVVMLGCMLVACGGGGGAPDAPAPIDAAPCPLGTKATVATARGYGSIINGALDATVLCVHGRADIPCQQSLGSFATLCMPTGVDVAVRASKFGWESTLLLYPPDVPAMYTELGDDAFIKPLWQAASGTYPSNTDAYITAFACDATTCPDAGAMDGFSGIANATFALTPSHPPVYADPNQSPMQALTMTSSSGMAYFTNVPPGTYDITVTAPGYTSCTHHDRSTGRSGGWASPTAGAAARFPALAGTNTEIMLRCTP